MLNRKERRAKAKALVVTREEKLRGKLFRASKPLYEHGLKKLGAGAGAWYVSGDDLDWLTIEELRNAVPSNRLKHWAGEEHGVWVFWSKPEERHAWFLTMEHGAVFVTEFSNQNPKLIGPSPASELPITDTEWQDDEEALFQSFGTSVPA